MRLIKATKEMEHEFYAFIQDWDDACETVIPYGARLLGRDYQSWLDDTYKFEHKDTCPSDFVPAHTYFAVLNDSTIVGAINIRHQLNDFLFNYGGHIGYGVRPSYRQLGYATQMLSLGLKIAREELNISKVLVCCDKQNVASAKTIASQGGILENEVNEGTDITQRYWIHL